MTRFKCWLRSVCIPTLLNLSHNIVHNTITGTVTTNNYEWTSIFEFLNVIENLNIRRSLFEHLNLRKTLLKYYYWNNIIQVRRYLYICTICMVWTLVMRVNITYGR